MTDDEKAEIRRHLRAIEAEILRGEQQERESSKSPRSDNKITSDAIDRIKGGSVGNSK